MVRMEMHGSRTSRRGRNGGMEHLRRRQRAGRHSQVHTSLPTAHTHRAAPPSHLLALQAPHQQPLGLQPLGLQPHSRLPPQLPRHRRRRWRPADAWRQALLCLAGHPLALGASVLRPWQAPAPPLQAPGPARAPAPSWSVWSPCRRPAFCQEQQCLGSSLEGARHSRCCPCGAGGIGLLSAHPANAVSLSSTLDTCCELLAPAWRPWGQPLQPLAAPGWQLD